MIRRKRHWLKILLPIILIGLPAVFLFLSKQLSSNPSITTEYSIPEIAWDVVWHQYYSPKFKIAFDYPESWSVTEETYKSLDAKDTFDRIYLCPPEHELITGKNIRENCIQFFSKESLIDPQKNFSDQGDIFNDYSKFVTQNHRTYDFGDADDTLFFKLQYTPVSSSNLGILLTGLYKDGLNGFIGLWQSMCTSGKNTECILVFKHILDSIHFDS